MKTQKEVEERIEYLKKHFWNPFCEPAILALEWVIEE